MHLVPAAGAAPGATRPPTRARGPLIVGAPHEDSDTTGINSTPSDPSINHNSGAAYVFERNGTTWSQQAYLKAGSGDLFGFSVALDGATAVVGAYKEDSNVAGVNSIPSDPSSDFDAGAAYFFTGAGPVSPALAQFNAAIAATGLTGPNADPAATPFGDGVSNLLKYAFNMNLSGPDSHQQTPGGPAGGLPAITTVPAVAPNQQAVLRIEFVRRTGSGLIYTPQKSTDLSNPAAWAPLTDTPTETPIDANWTRVVYEEPVDPAVLPLCFGRVQVTVP
jgi:FG-GAP repeat